MKTTMEPTIPLSPQVDQTSKPSYLVPRHVLKAGAMLLGTGLVLGLIRSAGVWQWYGSVVEKDESFDPSVSDDKALLDASPDISQREGLMTLDALKSIVSVDDAVLTAVEDLSLELADIELGEERHSKVTELSSEQRKGSRREVDSAMMGDRIASGLPGQPASLPVLKTISDIGLRDVPIQAKSSSIKLQDVQLEEHTLTAEELSQLTLTGLSELSSSKDVMRRRALMGNVTSDPFIKAWGWGGSEEAYALTTCTDGTVLVAGYTNSIGAGSSDVLILELSASGSLNWAKTWGGAGGDVALALTVRSDGTVLVAGQTSSVGAGGIDVLILELSASGSLNWVKTWGGAGDDKAYALMARADGTVLVAGNTQSVGAGNSDVLLLELSASGSLNWAKTWGGVDGDYAYALTARADGTVLVAGDTQSVGAGNEDVLLLELSASGSLNWAKTWGGAIYDSTSALTSRTDGTVLVAGYTNSVGAGAHDVLLLELSTSGNLNWAKTWGGTSNDIPRTLTVHADNTVLVFGDTASVGAGNEDVLVLELNVSGSLNWAKTWGGAGIDRVRALTTRADGTMLAAGHTDSLGVGLNDVLLLQVMPSGDAGEPGLVDWLSINEMDVTSSLTETVATTAWSNSNPGISLVTQSIAVVNATETFSETIIAIPPTPSISTTPSLTPSISVSPSPTPSSSRAPISTVPQWQTARITLSSDQALTLTRNQLSVTSRTAPDNQLWFTISNPVYAFFALALAPSERITEFTQQQVNEGEVLFVPDDSNQSPYFDIAVSDGEQHSTPLRVNVDWVSAPQLTQLELRMAQGETLTFTGPYLQGTIQDGDPSQIECEISELSHSTFLQSSDQSTVQSFSLAQYSNGEIQYRHDGTTVSPFFSLTPIYNGIRGIAINSRVTLIFTDSNGVVAPRVASNYLWVSEGGSTTLSGESLRVVNEQGQLAPDSTVLEISDLQSGQLHFTGDPSSAFTAFLQNELLSQQIQYTHDGSESLGAYTITPIFQGVRGAASPVRMIVRFINDPPILLTPLDNQEVTVGTVFTVNIGEHFADPEGQILDFAAYDTKTGVLPEGWTMESALGRLSGVPKTVGLTTLMINVTDPAQLWLGTQLIFNAKPGVAPEDNSVRNAVLGAVFSGLIGMGFLGLRLLIAYQARKRIDAALSGASKPSTVEKDLAHYRENTLRPIAQAIFQRVSIRGCGLLSEQQSAAYIDAVQLLISALGRRGINTDLRQLPAVEQSELTTQIADAAHLMLVSERRQCSQAWCASFFKADATPSQMRSAVDDIANAVQQMRREQGAIVSVQEVRSTVEEEQADTTMELATVAGLGS